MRTSNFALRLQPALLEAARDLAESEGVAVNQIINTAVAQMIAANSASNYISLRAKRANLPRALEILRKAGAGNPPIEGDELPESWKLRQATAAKPPARPATRKRLATRSK